MNILAIDSATNLEIISVSSDKKTSDVSGFVDNSHSVMIFDNINICLNKLGLTIRDIDIIGVGVGPGSFTGIRIAVTTARMISQILNIPLVGLKTHMIYTASVDTDVNENILVAFDARKGKVFGALYKKGKNMLHPHEIVTPGDYTIDFLLGKIDKSVKTYLLGNGIEKYSDTVSNRLDKKKNLRNFIPSGETTCKLILETYNKNPDNYFDFNNVVPCYSRKSDAEKAKE